MIRRIVTGHDDHGRAILTSDGPVEPVTLGLLPGFETFELWSTTESPPSIPDGTGEPGVAHYFPDAGGTVFRVVTFPPSTVSTASDVDVGSLLIEAQEKLPDLMSRLEPDNPGMHTTDSVDYGVVLEGELDLELDDGQTIHLTPGCCVVQRGTRHAWRNTSADVPARMTFILVGGTRAQ